MGKLHRKRTRRTPRNNEKKETKMIHLTVSGNLGRQATVKTLPSGRTITTFSLAHTPRFKKNDEWVDGETTWFTVTVNGAYPEMLLDKGANVLVAGDLQQKAYTDKETGLEKSNLFINATTIAVIPRRTSTGNDVSTEWSAPLTTATTVDDDAPF